jgi:hypothetical protein
MGHPSSIGPSVPCEALSEQQFSEQAHIFPDDHFIIGAEAD